VCVFTVTAATCFLAAVSCSFSNACVHTDTHVLQLYTDR
jgi:hypothetical protein